MGTNRPSSGLPTVSPVLAWVGLAIAGAAAGSEPPLHHVTPICEWEWADARTMELFWTPLAPDAPAGRAAAFAVCDPATAEEAFRQDRELSEGLRVTSYLAVDRIGTGLPVGVALAQLRFRDLEKGELAALDSTLLGKLRVAMERVDAAAKQGDAERAKLQDLVNARLEDRKPSWLKAYDFFTNQAIEREMRMRPAELPEELGLPREVLEDYAFSAPWIEPAATIGAELLAGLTPRERASLGRAVVSALAGRYWVSMGERRHIRTAAELGLEVAELSSVELEVPALCTLGRSAGVAEAESPCELTGVAADAYWSAPDRSVPSADLKKAACDRPLKNRGVERKVDAMVERFGAVWPVGELMRLIGVSERIEPFGSRLIAAGLEPEVYELLQEIENDGRLWAQTYAEVNTRAVAIVEAALSERPQQWLLDGWARSQLDRALRGRAAEVAEALEIDESVVRVAASSPMAGRVCEAAALFERLDPDQRRALASAIFELGREAREPAAP